jgi:hypothetical protein
MHRIIGVISLFLQVHYANIVSSLLFGGDEKVGTLSFE